MECGGGDGERGRGEGGGVDGTGQCAIGPSLVFWTIHKVTLVLVFIASLVETWRRWTFALELKSLQSSCRDTGLIESVAGWAQSLAKYE